MEEKNSTNNTGKKQGDDWAKLEEEFANHHIAGAPTQSTKRVVRANRFSTQETLQIAEIRDGIVILKDGSFKAVIEAEAINFDLMSVEECESVEYSYQAFLNSLYFPIQVNVLSRRVDAETYLKKIESTLKGQNNMLLSVLIEDYLIFVEDLLENTDIMDKKFYVVIPFYNNEFTKENVELAGKTLMSKIKNFNRKVSPVVVDEKTLDKARKELRYRIQTVTEGLRNCGVRSRPLSTKELIEMYYEFYNPETTLTQPLDDSDGFSAPFVSKAGDYRNRGKEAKEDEGFETEEQPTPVEAPEAAPTGSITQAPEAKGSPHEDN